MGWPGLRQRDRTFDRLFVTLSLRDHRGTTRDPAPDPGLANTDSLGYTMMHHAQDKIVVATVLLLDMVAYSKASVDIQVAAKDWINHAITAALDDLEGLDRIVSDTGDGAAISLLSNPEEAMHIAQRLLDAAMNPAEPAPLEVRFGISLGPLRIVKDINSQPNVLGDAINNAHRIMSFAHPGEVLVSGDYFNLLKRISNLYELHFLRRGWRRDKHGLRHELYVLRQGPEKCEEPLWTPNRMSALKRRSLVLMLVLMCLGFAEILINLGERLPPIELAFPVLDERSLDEAPNQPPLISTAAIEPMDRVQPPLLDTQPPAPPRLEPPEPATNGQVFLAVSPWGEVFVDGEKKVLVPPVNTMSLVPGTYDIEIRNKAQSYKTRLEVRAGTTQKIRYQFN